MADQKYRVTGDNEVLGHAPGSVFTADLSEEQEAFYIDGGHLAKAPANAKESEGEAVQTAAARAAASAPVPATAEEAAALQPVDPADESTKEEN